MRNENAQKYVIHNMLQVFKLEPIKKLFEQKNYDFYQNIFTEEMKFIDITL